MLGCHNREVDWLSILAVGAVGPVSSLVTTWFNSRGETSRIEIAATIADRRATTDRIREFDQRTIEVARDEMLAYIDACTAYFRGRRDINIPAGVTATHPRYSSGNETAAKALIDSMVEFVDTTLNERPGHPMPVAVLTALGEARLGVSQGDQRSAPSDRWG